MSFCCQALTAPCLACSAGLTVDEYCQQNPGTSGCPTTTCCQAMTPQCLACQQGLSVDQYCQQNPGTTGCPSGTSSSGTSSSGTSSSGTSGSGESGSQNGEGIPLSLVFSTLGVVVAIILLFMLFKGRRNNES